jgi:hypothetical protein
LVDILARCLSHLPFNEHVTTLGRICRAWSVACRQQTASPLTIDFSRNMIQTPSNHQEIMISLLTRYRPRHIILKRLPSLVIWNLLQDRHMNTLHSLSFRPDVRNIDLEEHRLFGRELSNVIHKCRTLNTLVIGDAGGDFEWPDMHDIMNPLIMNDIPLIHNLTRLSLDWISLSVLSTAPLPSSLISLSIKSGAIASDLESFRKLITATPQLTDVYLCACF